MRLILGIAFMGALGAVSRHLAGTWLKARVDTVMPLGTLGVNVLGSFLLGLLMALAISEVVSEDLRGPLAIGFLGSFTPFSTFSVETVQLVQQGRIQAAMLNVLLQLGLGFAAAAVGLALGRGLAA